MLMSLCEGMILSNSAFSYLAALLNTRRRYTLNLSDRVLQRGFQYLQFCV